ncbi:unnamed protein product [Periconia digitata]|uniref:J domain-containing protein n=1 Tax=Periconia digitata TaxID=1303443 RepID=A0A9W4UMF8_9PLEO|nr:unnamed protein product [Periconia digitata]
MSAKTSGADPRGTGDAKHRQHHDGSAGRAFTVEQKAAVIRIKRCGATAYYEILGLEDVKTTCTEGEIKKAYRKLSLLTHPDKNGYEGADEAFKMVSRAFQVLSDPDKKTKYDRYGGDPDSRFPGASSAGASPFSNFGRPSGAQRGPMYEEEISPEEMFRQFFGGGGAFGGPFGNGFDTGGFVFNMGGGGPGIRVHQFGGGRPRRRPGTATQDGQEPAPSLSSSLSALLPLIFLFVLPLLSSLFGSSAPQSPSVVFDQPRGAYSLARSSNKLGVPYWVNPSEVKGYSERDFRTLDGVAENKYIHTLNIRCENERIQQHKMTEEAYGWFSNDEVLMEKARNLPMPNCKKLKNMMK